MAKCKNCRNGAYLKDAYGDGYYWCFELEEDFGEDRIVIPCHEFIPKTNADRIRSMTDEELAEFLLKVNKAYAEPCMTGQSDCVWEDYPTRDKGCKDCFLEWLKSEMECE